MLQRCRSTVTRRGAPSDAGRAELEAERTVPRRFAPGTRTRRGRVGWGAAKSGRELALGTAMQTPWADESALAERTTIGVAIVNI